MSLPEPLRFAESVETGPSGAADDNLRVVHALQALRQRDRDQTGQFHGNVHVRTHGRDVAESHGLPNLPAELAQGLFKAGRTYPAVVRFSNSGSRPQPDVIPDGRGLEIKLFDAEPDPPTFDEDNRNDSRRGDN